MSIKDTLRIVVVGHVDHGKSTVIGRLLYDTNSLPEGAIERVKRISKEKGKPFEYAYLLDAFEEEQKQGITIDTTQLQFQTQERDYVIIDAPGHKEFLKNMISGAANAEAALLVIDAQEGIQEQSKRHGYILSLLGIQKVYVLVNKMDLIDYSEEKYDQIKREMNEFLHSLQVYPLKYIPLSAFLGENITEHSQKMDWYQGEPLLEALDLFEKDQGLEQKPLRFPIQDVYKFDHRRIIAGRIETGTLNVGDEIVILPSQKKTRVKSIEYWADRDQRDSVYAGMSVGITVEDEFFNQRGEFVVHSDDVPQVSKLFKANLFWLGQQPLVKQKEYKLKLATQEVQCEIQSITKVINASTLEHIEDANEVKINDVAEVIIKTKSEVCFDLFKNNSLTGRFVLVDGYDVSGGGIVSGTVDEIQTVSQFVQQDRKIAVHVFDEFYYSYTEQTVKKRERPAHTFYIGDVIPIQGETYHYPENVDIIDIKSRLVAKIRKAKLVQILLIDEYHYEGNPVMDSHGVGLYIQSEGNLRRFAGALKNLDYANKEQFADFATKWLYFGFFRTIGHWRREQIKADYEI